jgi:hypothetical protein
MSKSFRKASINSQRQRHRMPGAFCAALYMTIKHSKRCDSCSQDGAAEDAIILGYDAASMGTPIPNMLKEQGTLGTF